MQKKRPNNLEMLKFFLKYSCVIKNQYDNTNGYKMFEDLHLMLLNVESNKIKEFMQLEFGKLDRKI